MNIKAKILSLVLLLPLIACKPYQDGSGTSSDDADTGSSSLLFEFDVVEPFPSEQKDVTSDVKYSKLIVADSGAIAAVKNLPLAMSRWFFEGAQGKIGHGSTNDQGCVATDSFSAICGSSDKMEIRVTQGSDQRMVAQSVLKSLIAFQEIWRPLANQESGESRPPDNSNLKRVVANAWVQDVIDRANAYTNKIDQSAISQMAGTEEFMNKLWSSLAYRTLASPRAKDMTISCFPRSSLAFIEGAAPQKSTFDRQKCEKAMAALRPS